MDADHIYFGCRYWLEVLLHYSRLMKFKPHLHVDAFPMEEWLFKEPQVTRLANHTCDVC